MTGKHETWMMCSCLYSVPRIRWLGFYMRRNRSARFGAKRHFIVEPLLTLGWPCFSCGFSKGLTRLRSASTGDVVGHKTRCQCVGGVGRNSHHAKRRLSVSEYRIKSGQGAFQRFSPSNDGYMSESRDKSSGRHGSLDRVPTPTY